MHVLCTKSLHDAGLYQAPPWSFRRTCWECFPRPTKWRPRLRIQVLSPRLRWRTLQRTREQLPSGYSQDCSISIADMCRLPSRMNAETFVEYLSTPHSPERTVVVNAAFQRRSKVWRLLLLTMKEETFRVNT